MLLIDGGDVAVTVILGGDWNKGKKRWKLRL